MGTEARVTGTHPPVTGRDGSAASRDAVRLPLQGTAVASSDPKFSSLSSARRHLVRLLQDLHYGSVLDLLIRDGEPVFAPAPRLVRNVRLDDPTCNHPCPQVNARDFALRREVVTLMARLDDLRDGRVLQLDVLHGLPVRVKLEGAHAGQEGER